MAAYALHYSALCERARGRHIDGYSERHHIVPRCMGGSDDPSNIVRLTAEEHFVAHQLLVKMHHGHNGLLWAALAMTSGSYKTPGRIGNRLYGWLRRRLAIAAAERKPMLGKTHSAETKAKMSAASKGKPKSAAHRAALSEARRGKPINRGAEWRKNHKAAMRKIAKSRDLSFAQGPAYRAAQSAKMKQVWAERKRAALGS